MSTIIPKTECPPDAQEIGPRWILLAAAMIALTSASPANSPGPQGVDSTRDRLRHWNRVAIDTSGLDHTPVSRGEHRVFGEQLGPTAREPGDGDRPHRDLRRGERDRRPLRQLHRHRRRIRLYVDGRGDRRPAHDTLVALFPSQAAGSGSRLAADLQPDPRRARQGQRHRPRPAAAAAILALRDDDGSDRPEPRVGDRVHPGNGRGSGGRTRSAGIRSRSAPTGAR